MSITSRPDEIQQFINELDRNLFNLEEYLISPFREFIIDVDDYLNEVTSKNEKLSKEFVKNYFNNDSFHDHMLDLTMETYKYDSIYRNFNVSSNFLNAYSIFESFFKDLCKDYTDFYNIKLELKHIKEHNEIRKCKVYLDKAVGLNLNELDDTWNKIQGYQKIRNAIIHKNSKFDMNEIKNLNYLKSLSSINIHKDGKIFFTSVNFISNFSILYLNI
ncbi:hypothetical protein [Tenacibaculum sp. SG-28]|uniref:hypothetical protein n=1 Tax=Tenacibaculum sp. SG-28 TaxID=754426 RepID=UPI000CF50BC5|nr:hypothetical protein [Tenacibaculum sp. SG-28]PQJ23361.1 hypothetical protein BSU00_03985 [Tenacibaculum sp. SG-28]